MAARAAAILALVDGHLVVCVSTQLPLLEASVTERLPVADGADVGGDAAPRFALRVGVSVLRTVTVLALDVGEPRGLGELGEHRGPVVAGIVDQAGAEEGLVVRSIVEAVVGDGEIEAYRVAAEAVLSVVGVGVETVGKDLRVAGLRPGRELVRGGRSVVAAGAVIRERSPIHVLARDDAFPGPSVDLDGDDFIARKLGRVRHSEGIDSHHVGREVRALRCRVAECRTRASGRSQHPIVDAGIRTGLVVETVVVLVDMVFSVYEHRNSDGNVADAGGGLPG